MMSLDRHSAGWNAQRSGRVGGSDQPAQNNLLMAHGGELSDKRLLGCIVACCAWRVVTISRVTSSLYRSPAKCRFGSPSATGDAGKALLWDTSPAKDFTQAYPVGNGQLVRQETACPLERFLRRCTQLQRRQGTVGASPTRTPSFLKIVTALLCRERWCNSGRTMTSSLSATTRSSPENRRRLPPTHNRTPRPILQ